MTDKHAVWRRLGLVAGRSLVVGLIGGLVGGGLLYFAFGFIGFVGAPITSKIANGWRALLDPGLGKGLSVGAGIAVGFTGLTWAWAGLSRKFEQRSARPWLASIGGLMVIFANLEWLRSSSGWDLAGIATVFAMAAMTTVIVWLAAPWVLRDWTLRDRSRDSTDV
ncbi:MAG: hypothetical protein ACLFVZ_11515 [Actinomycetota bacterium]